MFNNPKVGDAYVRDGVVWKFNNKGEWEGVPATQSEMKDQDVSGESYVIECNVACTLRDLNNESFRIQIPFSISSEILHESIEGIAERHVDEFVTDIRNFILDPAYRMEAVGKRLQAHQNRFNELNKTTHIGTNRP